MSNIYGEFPPSGIELRDPLRYPGHGGMPERPAQRSHEPLVPTQPLSPFGRSVTSGQPLGKKVVLNYNAATEAAQFAPESILEFRGDDLDASQIQITLCAPNAIPRAAADIGIDVQNQTGEFSNGEVGAADYPGTGAPIIFPPFCARVRWGVGGARAEAIVDFGNGTTINLSCSSVDVTPLVPADAINAPGTSGPYALSGFITPGWPRPGGAQRTINLGAIASGADSNVFPVPKFAKDVTLVGCDASAGVPAVTVGYIRFFQSAGGVLTTNIGNYLINGNQPIPFRIPNGAEFFQVVSGFAPTSRWAAVFGLAI